MFTARLARSLVYRQIILLLIPAILILSSDPIEASPFVVRGQESLEKSHADSNITVDPCDDFCRFTYTTSPVNNLRRNPTFADATETFNEIFIEKSPSEPEFLIDIQNMYKGCLEEETFVELDLDSLREILKMLGDWPVVQGDWWPAKNASWRELQLKLSKMGFESFIKTYYSDEDNVMVLSPASYIFSSLNDSSRNSLQEKMIKIAVDMGADRNLAQQEIQKAMSFEINSLARVAFHGNNNTRWNYQEDLRNLARIFNTSTKEVMYLFPPHFNLSRDRLRLPEAKLYRLEVILDDLPIRDVFNYVLMRLIVNLTSFSNDLRERVDQCLDFVNARFPEAQEIIFVRRHLHKNTKKSVEQLINQVKEKVKEEAAELNQNLNMVRNWAYVDLSRIDSISLSLGYPDEFYDDQKVDDYYDYLVIETVNFFKGLFHYMHFKLANPQVPSFDFRENLNAYVPPTSNILSDGHISLMQLYSYAGNNTPKYVVYGELVSLLSKIICKTVSIKDYMHAHSFQMPQFKYQIKRSMEKRINDWKTQIPYSLYEDWLDIHGSESKPPGLENYTNRQIFWIYHSHLECDQENRYNQWWAINCGLRRAFKCDRFH